MKELSKKEIKEAVSEGAKLHNSLYRREIQDAIAQGVKDAMLEIERGKKS